MHEPLRKIIGALYYEDFIVVRIKGERKRGIEKALKMADIVQ